MKQAALRFLCCLALLAPGVASAQAFPTKPLRIVLGIGPGGFADVSARLVGQRLSERLGQPVLVENRPGAGGVVGAQAVAHAAPDGHTLFVMVGGNAIAKSLLKSIPFDLEKDFAPISSMGFFDLLLLVKGDSALKTFADVSALAATRPGGVTVGTTSTGSIQSLAAHLLTSSSGVKTTIIPYKTSAEIMAAVLRGDIDVGIDAYASLRGAIDSGQLRAVAATGPARSPLQPNVPTMKEQGIANYEVTSWNSLFATGGTPPATIALLNRHITEILKEPEVRKRFIDVGAEARGSTPQEMGALLKHSIEKWAAVIERAGIPKQ